MPPLKPEIKYEGDPCIHGHGILRYRAGDGCVECVRLNARKRYTINGDEFRARRRAAYATQGGRRDRKSRNLKQNYGITIEQYEAMAAAQGFLCAICGEPEARGLVVDHCHSNGHIRALLCVGCNLGLGAFSDAPDRLKRAAEYLHKHRRA